MTRVLATLRHRSSPIDQTCSARTPKTVSVVRLKPFLSWNLQEQFKDLFRITFNSKTSILAKHVIDNPGGRKPLPDEEKLGTGITVRYNPKQLKRLKRKAGDTPLRTYIRDSSLKATVRPPVSKELMKEIRNLNNLGTNVNLLAKAAAQSGFAAIANECREIAEALSRILHEARLKIKPREKEDTSLLQG